MPCTREVVELESTLALPLGFLYVLTLHVCVPAWRHVGINFEQGSALPSPEANALGRGQVRAHIRRTALFH